MKKVLGRGFGLVLGLALMLSLVAMPALAQEDYPCVFWGTAAVDGFPVAAGTNISAWVGMENIGWALTGEGTLNDDEFVLSALYDEQAGYVVSFKIGGLWANETAPWERYGEVWVDLTYGVPTVPVIAYSPGILEFSASQGGPNPASKTLQIWNSGAGTLAWTVDWDEPWLDLVPTMGSSTGEHDAVTVSVDISGMPAGFYLDTIVIYGTAAPNSPRYVPVELLILAPQVPVIAHSPPSFSFTASQGGPNPASKTLEIWNSGPGTLDWTVYKDLWWLGLVPPSGSSTGEHDAVTVSVDISGMTPGTHNNVITIEAPGAANTPQIVPVSVEILAPGVLVAEADGPYSGVVDKPVQLYGSASGGTPPYLYAWDLDWDGQYDDSYVQNPSWTWDTVAVHTVGLRVTDNTQAWDTDTATVNIIAAAAGVGGTPYPPDRFAILAPWIALGLAIIAGAAIVMRRRRAYS